MQRSKYFWIFWNKNEILKQKNDSTNPRICKHNQEALKKSTKVKEIECTNPKTKNQKCNDNNILKKEIYPKKKSLWSETEVYTDSSSIKGDLEIIKIHPPTINIPLEGKTKGICDYLQ